MFTFHKPQIQTDTERTDTYRYTQWSLKYGGLNMKNKQTIKLLIVSYAFFVYWGTICRFDSIYRLYNLVASLQVMIYSLFQSAI